MNAGIPPVARHPTTRRLAWCCRAVVRSAAIRPACTKRWRPRAMRRMVAGISIGAINAAIIAGNAPQDRVERLRQLLGGDHGSDQAVAARDRSAGHLRNAGQVWPWRLRSVSPASSAASQTSGGHPTIASAITRHRRSRRRWSGSSISDRITPTGDAAERRAVNVETGDSLTSLVQRWRSALSTSWPAVRCRRAFRPSRSTASRLGRAASLQHAAAITWGNYIRAQTG